MKPEQFAFSPSKLAPPRLGVRLLPRPRLLDALCQRLERRVVLLTAEAGYGKTSLLLSALGSIRCPVAWLTLDERDTDPSLFGAGVVLALRRVAPTLGKRALAVLAGGPSAPVLHATVLRCLEELPGETVLVLDDFHALDDTPAAKELADFLLHHLPSHVHVAIATRTRPALGSLSRLQVQGDASVLDRASLAFTPEEAADLLRATHGVDPGEPRVRAAAQRAEGWPAALTLLAQAVQSRGLPALEGTPREIFEYLATVVLDGLPVDLREFALRTSVLFEFTPALCEHVTGRADAPSRLLDLERRNLFVYRLDESGRRFRYHQLFSEFLRQRLERLAPDLVRELHVRAGRHFEQEGEGDQAVRHYLLGSAYDDAVRAIFPYRGGRLTAQRAYAFRDLVRRLPPAVAAAHPWLLRTAASSCRFIGDYEQALAWSRQALATSRGRDDDLWAHSVHGVMVMLTLLGRLREALAVGEDAVARVPDGVRASLRADLHAYLAIIRRHLGLVRQSARATETALRIDAASPSLDAQGQCLLNRGRLALVRFEPKAALEAFRTAQRYAEEQRSPFYQVIAWAGLAHSHLGLGAVDAAAQALERAGALHDQVGERTLDLELLVIAGDVALRKGDRSAAESSYRQVLGDVREGELATVRVGAHLGLARLAAARGDEAGALAHARTAAGLSGRGHLGSLLPAALLAEAAALAASPTASSALASVREADRIFAVWRSGSGRARCAWLEARILSRGRPRNGRTRLDAALTRAISLTGRHRPDVLPWLLAEAEWVAPLLVRALPVHARRAEGLLVSLGKGAVEALSVALRTEGTRVAAARALGAIGDARARRPLQQLLREEDRRPRAAAARALRMVAPPSAPALRISMLGRFELLLDGDPLPDRAWTTQKAKALLKLLVLHRPAGLHHEQAIAWLWPEQDRARGTASLKTAIKLVRRALEPGVEAAASRVVRREGPMLCFAADSAWVDLDEHARHLADARSHSSAGRLDPAIAALEHARVLYRGDLLDPEDRYEAWAEPARERVQRAHLDGLSRLSHLHAERGDDAGAAEALRAVLAIDPASESTYRDLMQYALRRGDREEVFALYAECAKKLREELGVEPAPATNRLLDDARRTA